ncbi:hypothetical protein Csa_015528, partial [Cucumis sativus]
MGEPWKLQGKGKPLEKKVSEMCRIVPEKTANMGNKQPKETEISQNQNPIGRIEERKQKKK